MALLSSASERMSSGIWCAVSVDWLVPGLEGVADLLPMNRFLGFFAFDVTAAGFDSMSAMMKGEMKLR